MITALQVMGNSLANLGRAVEVLECLTEALDLARHQSNSSQVLATQLEIAAIYTRQRNFKQAGESYESASREAEALGSAAILGACIFASANCRKSYGDLSGALTRATKAYEIFEQVGNLEAMDRAVELVNSLKALTEPWS
ncbi:hypothetical protein ABZ379_39090 [Streptomyces canus]|uniref:hypothetical protein n=1 Tax=Streptomyces canus TaxID=58343 RepID=UPI00340AC1B3